MQTAACLSLDKENIRQIQRITWVSVVVNSFLAVVKLTLGVIGHSQAVVADAVHSFTDLVSDIVLLFGVKIWTKPPDEQHPYGHGRIEAIVSTIIGLPLIVMGVMIGYNAIATIQESHVQPHWIALVGAGLSIIIKEILYRWTMVVGKRVKSSAVQANAIDHRADAFSSIPVALAVLVAIISPRWAVLDHIGAFIVSLFILYSGWSIISSALHEIVDTGANEKLLVRIEKIILSTPGVKSYHALRTRRMGPGWYVDFHVQVDGDMSVRAGHDISEVVKQNLFKDGPDVLDVVVHLEPYGEVLPRAARVGGSVLEGGAGTS